MHDTSFDMQARTGRETLLLGWMRILMHGMPLEQRLLALTICDEDIPALGDPRVPEIRKVWDELMALNSALTIH